MSRPAIDVSPLPSYAFGHRSLMWWGTLGMMAIEGTVFALAIASYFFLRGRADEWPISAHPPLLFWGTLNTVLLLASSVPNQLAKRAAERLDLPKVQLWLFVCLAFGVAFIVVRAYEFTTLNIWWDQNAYGSLIWLLLGLHTTHVVTDVADTAVLTVLMVTGPVDETRFVDVSENALYWYFVLIAWLPIYAVIYFAPRMG
jgi:heme/copper-type cytochrome/quinol oxidase subunit 3